MGRLTALGGAALALLPAAAGAAPCAAPDHLSRVTGGDECLVIRTFAPPAREATRTLYVLLHGNHSNSRGPAVSLYPVAERLAAAAPADALAVALIRPGYPDDQGNTSGGHDAGRADNWYAGNIDIVADALRRLKAFHGARRLVLVGHSGGAATAGVILGRHPGLADAAVLAGCPCDVPAWRLLRRGPTWSSESPHRYVARIPPGTPVVVLVGDRDEVTQPVYSSSYVAMLQARGLPAELEQVPGADHRSVIDLPRLIEAALRLGRAN